MFEKMIDDFKARAAAQLRLSCLVATAAAALLIAFAFLCAAGFVHVYQHYGLIEACYAGAGLFLIIAVLTGAYVMAQRAQAEREAERARLAAKAKEKTLLQTVLSDPLVVASALQVVRAVGVRRLIPLLAIGGLGLGLWAGAGKRSGKDDTDTP